LHPVHLSSLNSLQMCLHDFKTFASGELKEYSMKIHRNYIKIAAIAIAISAALPALADETTVSVGKHHFVYYRDHDIYYAPERKTYYWMADGKWQSGPALRVEDQRYYRENKLLKLIRPRN